MWAVIADSATELDCTNAFLAKAAVPGLTDDDRLSFRMF
jgi:hypothetical protein